ncbi:MAG: hypothetical protein AAFZ65_10030, partial [Planctomycetota bacterium]
AELHRTDVCIRCWDARDADARPELWWRARRQPAAKQGLAIDMEGLEAVFHQLADNQNERHRELRYVLCLLLMRKRRLLMNRAVRRKGGEFLLVRRPRRKDEIEVEVFDLSSDRLDEIRAGLQRLFEGEGLEDPAAIPADEEPAVGEGDGAEASVAVGDPEGEPTEVEAPPETA